MMKKTISFLVGGLLMVGVIVAFDVKNDTTEKPKSQVYNYVPPKVLTFTYTQQQINTRLQIFRYAVQYTGKVGPSDIIDAVRDSIASFYQEDIKQWSLALKQDSLNQLQAKNESTIPQTAPIKKGKN
jgi:hypothetical protein